MLLAAGVPLWCVCARSRGGCTAGRAVLGYVEINDRDLSLFNLKKGHLFLICLKVSYGPSRPCPGSQRCGLYSVVRPHAARPYIKFSSLVTKVLLPGSAVTWSQSLNHEAGPRTPPLPSVHCI